MNRAEFVELYQILIEMIMYDLRYFFTYPATVANISDSENLGDVFLECAHLEAVDKKSWLRATCVQSPRAHSVPKVGDKGVVSFVYGNAADAKFHPDPITSKIKKQATQRIHTLIETANVSSLLEVDEDKGFTMNSQSKTGKQTAPEPTVLGDKLKALLDFQMGINKDLYDHVNELYTMMVSHYHTAPMGPTSPANGDVPVKAPIQQAKAKKSKVDIDLEKTKYAVPGKLRSAVNKAN